MDFEKILIPFPTRFIHNWGLRSATKPTFEYDVFLSHNHAQKDWTRKLAHDLDAKEINVWFDEWSLPAGTVASEGMELGIEQSRHVVLVLSPEFLDSEWTGYETQLALVDDPAGRDLKLIPILYSNCELPRRISRLSWIDFREAHGDEARYAYHLQQLLAALRPDLYERPRFFQALQAAEDQDPEKIPPAGRLPRGSRMPRASSSFFVGREKELRQLSQSLTPGVKAMVGVHAAFTGMGGVGKTQLAVEYAHRYGRRYPGGIFWLNMENADNAINEVASCGGPEGMNLPHFNDLKTLKQAAAVIKQWEGGNQARLLIFDNAEDPEVVEHWRPKTGLCSMLITSRRRGWPLEMGVQALAVEMLPRQDSLQMLEKARPKLAQHADERESASELCDFLGDLPLALKVAAAYLQKYHSETIASYLQLLRETSTGDSELKDVWACFTVSYQKLKRNHRTDALSLRLFHLAAYFAPVSISRSLLGRAAGLNDIKDVDRHSFSEAVARLEELGLVSQQPDGRVLLHRLLRQFARSFRKLNDAKYDYWNPLNEFGGYLNVLDMACREQNGRPLLQSILRDLMWSLSRPSSLLLVLRDEVSTMRHLLHRSAWFRRGSGRGQRRVAKTVWKLLLAFARSTIQGGLPQEFTQERQHLREAAIEAQQLNPRVAVELYISLGEQARILALLPEAKADFERTLQIAEQFCPLYKTVGIVLSLGRVLHEQGDLEAALKCYKRALKISKQAWGPTYLHLANSLNNIGLVLKDQGNLPEAMDYGVRALEAAERTLGPDHPRIALFANNIAMILMDQKNLTEAMDYAIRALKIEKQVFGPNHPDVAKSLNNIGMILRDQGDLVHALEHLRQALTISEQVYGSDHPNVARNLRNISIILTDQGDLATALDYAQHALNIHQQVYGFDHPEVARDADSIGAILHRQGNLVAALEYMQRALKIDERVYGPDHPTVAAIAKNISRLLQEQG